MVVYSFFNGKGYRVPPHPDTNTFRVAVFYWLQIQHCKCARIPSSWWRCEVLFFTVILTVRTPRAGKEATSQNSSERKHWPKCFYRSYGSPGEPFWLVVRSFTAEWLIAICIKLSCVRLSFTSVTALQLYSFTALQLYSFIALQLYSFIALQRYSFIALQLYSFIALQRYIFIALQLYSVTALQRYSFTALQLYSVTALQLYCCRSSVLSLLSLYRSAGSEPPAGKVRLVG